MRVSHQAGQEEGPSLASKCWGLCAYLSILAGYVAWTRAGNAEGGDDDTDQYNFKVIWERLEYFLSDSSSDDDEEEDEPLQCDRRLEEREDNWLGESGPSSFFASTCSSLQSAALPASALGLLESNKRGSTAIITASTTTKRGRDVVGYIILRAENDVSVQCSHLAISGGTSRRRALAAKLVLIAEQLCLKYSFRVLVIHFSAIEWGLMEIFDHLGYERVSMGDLLTIQIRKELQPPPVCQNHRLDAAAPAEGYDRNHLPGRRRRMPTAEERPVATEGEERVATTRYYTPAITAWWARLIAHSLRVLRPPSSDGDGGVVMVFEDPLQTVIEMRGCTCCCSGSPRGASWSTTSSLRDASRLPPTRSSSRV